MIKEMMSFYQRGNDYIVCLITNDGSYLTIRVNDALQPVICLSNEPFFYLDERERHTVLNYIRKQRMRLLLNVKG